MDGFTEFWALQKCKVGKLAAERAYKTALRRASHDEIMDGYRRYIVAKPDWQAWVHPRTFLTQGRWMDEVDPAPGCLFKTEGWTCPSDPPCPASTTRADCYRRAVLEAGRRNVSA